MTEHLERLVTFHGSLIVGLKLGIDGSGSIIPRKR